MKSKIIYHIPYHGYMPRLRFAALSMVQGPDPDTLQVIFPDGNYLSEEKIICKSDLDPRLSKLCPGPWTRPCPGRTAVGSWSLDRLEVVEAAARLSADYTPDRDLAKSLSLYKALDDLAPRWADIIKMIWLHDVPYIGIQDLYGVSQSCVSYWARRGRKVLKNIVLSPSTSDADWARALDKVRGAWKKGRIGGHGHHWHADADMALSMARDLCRTRSQTVVGRLYGCPQCFVRKICHEILDILQGPGLGPVHRALDRALDLCREGGQLQIVEGRIQGGYRARALALSKAWRKTS